MFAFIPAYPCLRAHNFSIHTPRTWCSKKNNQTGAWRTGMDGSSWVRSVHASQNTTDCVQHTPKTLERKKTTGAMCVQSAWEKRDISQNSGRWESSTLSLTSSFPHFQMRNRCLLSPLKSTLVPPVCTLRTQFCVVPDSIIHFRFQPLLPARR